MISINESDYVDANELQSAYKALVKKYAGSGITFHMASKATVHHNDKFTGATIEWHGLEGTPTIARKFIDRLSKATKDLEDFNSKYVGKEIYIDKMHL